MKVVFHWCLLYKEKNFFFNVYLFLGQRQSMNGGGSEREGDTESEAGSRLRAISPEPDAGLELTDREIVTWLKSDAQPTALPRRPFNFFFNVFYLFLGQRETEHEWGRGRERETQNQKQAPGSEPSAQSLMRGSNSRTARS